MPKKNIRSYSRYSINATILLGQLIRLGRKERAMTVKDLADRVGVSRGMVQRIEQGNLKCEIGIAFEIAAIVGVELFNNDNLSLKMQMERTNDKIALLPKSVRKKKRIDDDF